MVAISLLLMLLISSTTYLLCPGQYGGRSDVSEQQDSRGGAKSLHYFRCSGKSHDVQVVKSLSTSSALLCFVFFFCSFPNALDWFTMRGLVCGPKMAACGIVLSLWGVIMLVSRRLLLFTFRLSRLCCQWETAELSITAL